MLATLQLLDITAYGRQETWEDSPANYPQDTAGSWWCRRGRHIAQWTRTSEAVADAVFRIDDPQAEGLQALGSTIMNFAHIKTDALRTVVECWLTTPTPPK